MFFKDLREARVAGEKAKRDHDESSLFEWREAIKGLTEEFNKLYTQEPTLDYSQTQRVTSIPLETMLLREAIEAYLPENKAIAPAHASGVEGEFNVYP